MKHKIKPHKGGRTEQARIRITLEEKALIDQARGKMSLADWMVQKAKEELEKQQSRAK